MGYGLDGWDPNSQQRQEIFLYSTMSTLAMMLIQPPIQWVPGALSPRLKQLGHEADHSPSSSAEDKKGDAIPPLPHTSSWKLTFSSYSKTYACHVLSMHFAGPSIMYSFHKGCAHARIYKQTLL
jgi:hypothetical protein